MGNQEENMEGISTNASEIFQEWKTGENYVEDVEKVILDYLERVDEAVKTLNIEIPVQKPEFKFDDDFVEFLQDSFYDVPHELSYNLTYNDDGTKYVVNIFSWIKADGSVRNIRTNPYRVDENGDVEIYTDNWETVDPELIEMFVPDTRDEAVYDLFMAMRPFDGRLVLYYDIEEVKNIIAENEKLLTLYRAMSPITELMVNETVMPTPTVLLMPLNPYRNYLNVFLANGRLVLGCVLMDTDEMRPVIIYDTDSVEKMTEVLNIIWDPTEIESEANSEPLYSGSFYDDEANQ